MKNSLLILIACCLTVSCTPACPLSPKGFGLKSLVKTQGERDHLKNRKRAAAYMKTAAARRNNAK